LTLTGRVRFPDCQRTATLWNLAGSYDLGNGLTAYAWIDNLFDRHYQDPIGFLRPGLGVFAGLRVAFDAAAPMR
jgi:outer membrane receptor protein involved in Fe transport